MQEYTLGVIFSKDMNNILLITRGKHDFHAHKTNALGGKILIGESPIECIIREIQEEAGIKTKESDWRFMGILNGNTWKVWVFSAKLEEKNITETTPEGTIAWTALNTLPNTIVRNLRWIIPFCIDKWSDPEVQSFVVWYSQLQVAQQT